MKKIRITALLTALAMMMLLLSSCNLETDKNTPEPTPVVTPYVEPKFTDNADIYKDDDPASVIYFYVTVTRGTDSDKANHTFAEVSAADHTTPDDIRAYFTLQEGDANGPIEGKYSSTEPVGTIEIRGATARKAVQKSYKLKIFDEKPAWHEQRNLALNKHQYDHSRLRNMLAFNLIKKVPDMISLRTQFIRMMVKDEASGETSFKDYGLFTQVEVPNKRYLKNHNLDSNGQLYKANNFAFHRYADKLKLKTDPTYNDEEFQSVLEIKGNDNHNKIIELLDTLQAGKTDIDTIIDTYFDRDNYLNWMAMNLLIGNRDVISQNFFLYSPLASKKFYFIPWDYDGSLTTLEYQNRNKILQYWQTGICTFWSSPLHRQFLQVKKNRDDLAATVSELSNVLNKDSVLEILNKIIPVIKEHSFKEPDLINMQETEAEFNEIIANIPSDIEANLQKFNESLTFPQPFFINEPKQNENDTQISWQSSYDINGEKVKYSVFFGTDFEFKTGIIYSASDLEKTYAIIPKLAPGIYYFKVVATNQSGKTMTAFDDFVSPEGTRYSGVRKCEIK